MCESEGEYEYLWVWYDWNSYFSVTGKAILDSNLLIDEIIYFILLLFKHKGLEGKMEMISSANVRADAVEASLGESMLVDSLWFS